MRNKIIIIILSVFLISCKGNGQEKRQTKENVKDKIDLTNSTFLGVIKTDSLYTVYNRCDGGYPVLRFKKNEFYFYSPQEGTNYIIKEIKGSNDKYVINTNGYYFLKGENVLKQNDTWYLEKQNDLLWNFKNKNWNKTIILSDSLNLNSKKISYKIQPCSECSEDCEEHTTNNNLIGNWKTKCESPIGISIKENEITITVEPNQYYIHLSKIGNKNGTITYKLKQLEGLGSKDIDSDVYHNEKEVAAIKDLGNDKIEFNWLGFYNKSNNQRQYTEPLFSNVNPIILKRCDE